MELSADGRPASGPAARVFTPYLLAIAGAALLCAFAVWNRYPLVYFDTVAYLQRPTDALAQVFGPGEWSSATLHLGGPPGASHPSPDAGGKDDVWMAGRSIYYGLFNALLIQIGTVWLAIFIQGWIVAATIAVAWFRSGASSRVGYLVLMVGLTVATTASVFVSTLLPDVLGGAAIVAAAALVAFWERLRVLDKVFLGLAMSYAAVSHDSLLLLLAAVAAGLFVLIGGWRLVLAARKAATPAFLRFAPIAPIAAAVVVGLVANFIFGFAAQTVTGNPPMRLPHLSARLATQDFGRSYLREVCPEAGYALCRYQDRLGTTWIAFLFDRQAGVFATASRPAQRELSDQQVRFAVDLTLHRPGDTLGLFATDFYRQVTMTSLADLRPEANAPYLRQRLAPQLQAKIFSSRSYRDRSEALMRGSSFATRIGYAAAAALAALFIYRGATRGFGPAEVFAGALLAGFLLNAVICATVASPYDRFQARVAWLVPLAAAFLAWHAIAWRQPGFVVGGRPTFSGGRDR